MIRRYYESIVSHTPGIHLNIRMDNNEALLGHINRISNNRGQEVEFYAEMCKTCETGLDKRMITVIMELLENNVDPNSIVDMINELRNMKRNF